MQMAELMRKVIETSGGHRKAGSSRGGHKPGYLPGRYLMNFGPVQFLPGVRGGTLGDLNFGSTGGPCKTGLARNLQLSLKFLF
jgi:hypothetical protein